MLAGNADWVMSLALRHNHNTANLKRSERSHTHIHKPVKLKDSQKHTNNAEHHILSKEDTMYTTSQ